MVAEQTLGNQGAKQQTWTPDNPRALLKRLADENIGATEQVLRALMADAINHDPLPYVQALLAYWWPSNYRSLFEAKTTRKRNTLTVSELVDQMRARLFDLVLSNGKTLRNCTFAECAKESGWLLALSKKGKPNELVGKKLTLKQVGEIWIPPATQ